MSRPSVRTQLTRSLGPPHLVMVAAGITMMLSLPACDSFLNETPKDFLAPSNFWRDEGSAITAVNGVYFILEDYGRAPLTYLMTDMMTGDEGRQGVFFMNDIWVEDFWPQWYEGINRANEVIENVPSIENIAPDLQNRVVGEAKFLRAYFYFDLVQLLGDVPLVLEPTKGTENVEVERTPIAEVYSAIVSDLRAATEVLPLEYTSSDDVGRATKGAAKTLLVEVYLTMAGEPLRDPSHLEEAKQLLTEVMNSGVYDLEAEYEDNFDVATGNGIESIFEIQKERSRPLENGYMIWHFPSNLQHLPQFGRGFNNVMIMPGLLDAFEEGDARRDLIWSEYDTGDEVIQFDWPFHQKYYDFGAPGQNYFLSGVNVPRLRYAEVLLMYAEIENMLNGPTAEAYAQINRVRRRAGLGDLTPGLSQGEFAEAVLHERRVEFYGEAQRWFDLKRLGRLLEFARAAGYENESIIGERYLLMPIPESELLKNPSLTQNPGW